MFDTDVIMNFTLASAATVPVIIAIVQALKMTQWIKDKYAPILSIVVGILVSMMFVDDFRIDLSGTILSGVLFGLSASGLYSGVKTTANAIKADRANEAKRHK